MTRSTTKTQEEPFLSWICREWCLVLVTMGIGLDWLPSVLSSPESSQIAQLSGTKLIILPGLALAFASRPGWIWKPHVLGVSYLAALLIGGSAGWLAGTVGIWRLIAIGINGLLLLYFLRVRSLISIQRVLAISFALSMLVPAVQWMTRVGIISAVAIEEGDGFQRVFSIFDSATVGFFPLMIAACLGGLTFIRDRKKQNIGRALAAVSVVSFGLTGSLLAAQRSGVAAYVASFLTALALHVLSERRRPMWILKLSLVLVVAILAGVLLFQDLAGSVIVRFASSTAMDEAKDLRYGGVVQFLSDLSNPFYLAPRGAQSLLDKTGVDPHLLLSEAYYEGGPLFLIALVAILIRFGIACISLVRSTDTTAQAIGRCLFSFGCGAAIQLSVQTGLVLRFLPVALGLGIASHDILQNRAARRTNAGSLQQNMGSLDIQAGAQ